MTRERSAVTSLPRLIVDAMARLLAGRNLRSDRFGTLAAIAGVAIGAATVGTVVILDVNTTRVEAERAAGERAAARAEAPAAGETVSITPVRRGAPAADTSHVKKKAREDFEILRAGIRGGSLTAFAVGALIVFFTFTAVIDRRRREVALLRSLGALPAQVAAVFVREAAIVGGAGGALGMLASIPMAYLAARAGVTTTGHLKIAPGSLVYPWPWMLVTAAAGSAAALIGVIRPVRAVIALPIARALRPRFADGEASAAAARRTGIAGVALPIALAAYAAARPAIRRALAPVPFHAVEAVAVCLAFVAALVLIPGLVRRLGALLFRALPGPPSAARLLTQRRVEHLGHELSWPVSAVMVVFSLLLTLHIVTAGLKREIFAWADEALHDETFVLPWYPKLRADMITPSLPPGERVVYLSGRTPWPNALHAARAADLAALAEDNGRPDLAEMARRLGAGKIILSRLMARRLGVSEGDAIDVSGRGGDKRLTIVGITDGLGFTPMNAPHRNARTYGLIDAADEALIAPYADSLGAVAIIGRSSTPALNRWRGGDPEALQQRRGIYLMTARFYKGLRLREANSDFLIFDVLLALTSALAAMGIANQLVLSVRARAGEIAIYRALGMTRGQVRRLVILEGVIVGLLGGCLAALLGVPLGYTAVGAVRAVSNFDVSFTLPPAYVIVTIASATLVSTLAALVPAARAARPDRAESAYHE